LFTRSERSLTTSLMRVKKLWKYEVKCKGKMCLGPSHEKTQQMCELGKQICRCSCRKPQLLHTPCIHVITVCYEVQNFIHRRTCLGTTRRKLFGTLGTEQLRATSCGVLSLRTPKQNFVYTPDPDLDMCQGVGRQKKKRIRNNTDEA
jgi:hypothetical protein